MKIKLSSTEYQKARKQKSFNPKLWFWDPEEKLYLKVEYTLEVETKKKGGK